ncbi:helix-turn-helix transcriptional regulator [Leifsonia sp. Leaf264]|uniref:helix-turn-helix transcriptional regulator n=1 Tax=Leifsonia sp. Leaf264 TaxID=1736314 RepID=UPI0006FA5E48|nr:helix-turn-helix domain-containing protein [Leifsonia sp. Leaf264]KQP01452.1 hypothetical protein ASF30_02205 [Leifsonia sp. Leaf264]
MTSIEPAGIAPVTPIRVWTFDDVAEYFCVSVKTVERWRSGKVAGITFPPAIVVGRNVRWEPQDVIDWAAEQKEPTPVVAAVREDNEYVGVDLRSDRRRKKAA